MEDGIEAVLGEDALEQSGVTKVALDAGEAGKGIFVLFEVDVDYGMAFAQKAALENSTEEAGGSSDEVVRHTEIVLRRGRRTEILVCGKHIFYNPENRSRG
jgi:hypothetical protein